MCNVQPCTEQRLSLSIALSLGGGALGLASSAVGRAPTAQWDAFAAALVQDLAAVISVSQLRVRILDVSPPATGVNTSLLLSLVTITVLPPSSSSSTCSSSSKVSGSKGRDCIPRRFVFGHLFRDADQNGRVFIPFVSNEMSEDDKKVIHWLGATLGDHGYELVDVKGGYARQKGKSNLVRIGKLLFYHLVDHQDWHPRQIVYHHF
jgi:hypothetical protein